MGMILYKVDPSPPVRAVFMTLEVLGITDVEFVDVNLIKGEHLKEDYLQVNPQHTVPTFKDGDLIIWDSHAITTYLVNQYADDHSIYPRDPKKRAIIDQRLHFDSGILFTAARSTLEPVLFWGETAWRPENLEKIKAAYKFTEQFLTSPWLAGDTLTLADICCVASISSMHDVLPIDKETHPKLTAWFARMAAQDFYKKWNVPGLAELKQMTAEKLK